MKVTIDGVDYPMPSEFTYEEMGVMKRVSGLTAGELYEALDRRDSDAGLAFAAAVLLRENPGLTWEDIKTRLGSLKLGTIRLDFRRDTEEIELPKDDAAGK